MTLALALTAISPSRAQTLKEAFKDDFLVGVAVAQPIISRNQTASIDLICEQFNAVSPESVLKPEYIHPTPDRWNFEPGDAYCKFAADHGLKALGHTLMWHNQTPDFFWLNPDGSVRSDEEMRQTLVEYIEKTVTHFKGKVYAWDVVNEIVSEDHNRSDEGNGFYRKDKGWEKYYRGNKVENKADEGPYMAMRLNEQRFETSTGGYEHEEIIMQGGQPKRDVWVHALYRQKGKTGELYLDGKLIGRNTNMPILTEIFDEAPANCWIGRAPFRGDKYLTHTQVADFRIYNYAVDDKTMKQLNKDKAKLKF